MPVNATIVLAALLAAAAAGWWFLREGPAVAPPPSSGSGRTSRPVEEEDPPPSKRPDVPPPPPPSLPPPPPADAPLHETAIAGTMVSASGRPLPAGFTAEIYLETDMSKAHAVVPVRGDGAFATGELPAKERFLVVGKSAAGFTAGSAAGVASGARDLRVPLQSGGTIAGRVLDRDGSPVGAGVTVSASIANPAAHRPGSSSSTVTADDGTFVIEFLGNFIFTVTAVRETPSGPQRASGSDHRPGTTHLEIRLE